MTQSFRLWYSPSLPQPPHISRSQLSSSVDMQPQLVCRHNLTITNQRMITRTQESDVKRKVSCVLIVQSHCEFIWSISIISLPLLPSLPSLRFSDTEYPNWWIIPLDNSREASSHHSTHNILIRFRYIGAHLNDITQYIRQWGTEYNG